MQISSHLLAKLTRAEQHDSRGTAGKGSAYADARHVDHRHVDQYLLVELQLSIHKLTSLSLRLTLFLR